MAWAASSAAGLAQQIIVAPVSRLTLTPGRRPPHVRSGGEIAVLTAPAYFQAPPQRAQGSLMARYFFDIQDGWRSMDSTGREFATVGAARMEAVKLAAEILRSRAEDFLAELDWRFFVRDEHREIVLSLSITGELDASSA